MAIYGPFSTAASTGGAGVSTANVDTSTIIRGFVVQAYIQYNDSPPATTDVTIKTKGITGILPSYNVLVVSNANTSGYFLPQKEGSKSTDGTASGQYGYPYVEDILNIVIAQANDGDSITVWLWVVS